MRINRLLPALAIVASLAFTACGDDDEAGDGGAPASAETTTEELSGEIRIDGSSTVFPFAQAAAELFNEQHGDVRISVGQSGTGGGFEKFCAGSTDISDASRPIDEEEEVPVCEENGVEFDQVAVANDGISVVTSPELPVDCLTVDQLQQLWEPKSKIRNLSEIDPSLPDQELTLFGPGTDSGTFDFFTEQINGEEGVSREDYEASEDDNILVQGVSGSPGGLGYFGFSYYEQNADSLNLVGVGEDEASCAKPSVESIQDGSYAPLGRQIFMYPSAQALQRPEVKAFVDFTIENAVQIAEAVNIVPLTDQQIQEAQQKVESLGGGA